MAGYATGKVSARTLAVIGFSLFVLTFRYAANVTTLQMTFQAASWLRVVQMMPIPFCFISITTAAYVGMPQEESNQVSGLINFVRNIGGSILIALTNAGDQPRHLAPAAPAKRHDLCQFRLPATNAGAGRLSGQQIRRGQRPRHGPGLHL
jgi:DHA2 family multidrug resistance protein